MLRCLDVRRTARLTVKIAASAAAIVAASVGLVNHTEPRLSARDLARAVTDAALLPPTHTQRIHLEREYERRLADGTLRKAWKTAAGRQILSAIHLPARARLVRVDFAPSSRHPDTPEQARFENYVHSVASNAAYHTVFSTDWDLWRRYTLPAGSDASVVARNIARDLGPRWTANFTQPLGHRAKRYFSADFCDGRPMVIVHVRPLTTGVGLEMELAGGIDGDGIICS